MSHGGYGEPGWYPSTAVGWLNDGSLSRLACPPHLTD
ncbi:MAG: hypothetical protein QOG01_2437 [Pseudonocardiales bacterium]|jgi:hypothetical protein|nr:hypothetical protein [Pseudonocardiales bacterium]